MQQGLDGNRPRDLAPLDPRWVELILAGLVAGCAFIVLPRSILVPSLLVPALAVYAAALARRWSAGGRLGAFLLLLAVVGVAPTLATMDAYHTSFLPTYGHDGGVIVTGRATEELLAGHNPYTVSYAGSLRGSALLIDGTWTGNPILDRYPYSPGTFLVQVPFTAAALALGTRPTPAGCTCWSMSRSRSAWPGGAFGIGAISSSPCSCWPTRCSCRSCGRGRPTSCSSPAWPGWPGPWPGTARWWGRWRSGSRSPSSSCWPRSRWSSWPGWRPGRGGAAWSGRRPYGRPGRWPCPAP